MAAGAAIDADHEAKSVRHLQPVTYPIAALALAHAGCTTRQLYDIVGGYITSQPQPADFAPVMDWLQVAITQGTGTSSRVARPMPAGAVPDGNFDRQALTRLRPQLPRLYDPIVHSQATQPELTAAVKSLENTTTALVTTTQQTIQATSSKVKTPSEYYLSNKHELYVLQNIQDDTQVNTTVVNAINAKKTGARASIQKSAKNMKKTLKLPYIPLISIDMKDDVVH